MKKLIALALMACACTFLRAEKITYFPHFADGGGVRTTIVVTNPCAKDALVTLTLYDRSGGYQTVDGIGRLTFFLAAHAIRVFAFSGASSPVKSGYATLASEVEAVTGTAVFTFSSGMEAGVLPVKPAKRFGFFVETNASMSTGIAVLRTDNVEPIEAVLFNAAGQEVNRVAAPISGLQNACFLTEMFTGLPVDFKGYLQLTSRRPFAPVGLRFGGGVLSTVAVDQAKPIEQLMLEKLLGMWFFEYKISSTWVDEYVLHQAYEDSQDPGQFFIAGKSEYWKATAGLYSPVLEKFLVLCSGLTIDYLYQFAFTGVNQVSGCYYVQYSDGSLSSCYALIGLRLDMENPPAMTLSLASAQKAGPAGEEERVFQDGNSRCEPSPELLMEVRALRKKLGATNSAGR